MSSELSAPISTKNDATKAALRVPWLIASLTVLRIAWPRGELLAPPEYFDVSVSRAVRKRRCERLLNRRGNGIIGSKGRFAGGGYLGRKDRAQHRHADSSTH